MSGEVYETDETQQGGGKQGGYGHQNQYAKLDRLAAKLGLDDWGDTGFFGGPKSMKQRKWAKKYMLIYNKLKRKGADLSGLGTFDIHGPELTYTPYEELEDVYEPEPGTMVGEGPTPGEGGEAPPGEGGETPPGEGGEAEEPPESIEDVTEDPFGPGFEEILQTLVEGLPEGINLKNKEHVKMLETMYPMIIDAYNQKMTQEAIGTQALSLEDYQNDPMLQAISQGVMAQLSDPYTYDDETVNLMRSQAADTLANQEAAMGERLQALGASQGISPDSPLYASMASQAALARDLGMQQMERDLQIEKAKQDKMDEYQALAAGGQWAGAYQTGLGQRYGMLSGTQLGGKYADLGNPFQGMWQGLLMENQLNQDSSFLDKYGGLIGSIIQGGGQAVGGAMQAYGNYSGGGMGGGGMGGGGGMSGGSGGTM